MASEPLSSSPVLKQARAHRTRSRLVDATVASLVAHGLAGTSTTVVAQAAGVSQGALFKHFPNKSLLLASAAEVVFVDLVERYQRDLLAATRTGADRFDAAVDLLWQIFTTPELGAVFELFLAARTDDDLRATLAPVLERHQANLLRTARSLFPVAAKSHPDFDALIEGILMTMQGCALMAMAIPAPAEQLGFVRHIVERELRTLEEVQ